ncbi:Outer membrane stress sensor protease DegQ, serine protease [hydrothermal vent metagenome]|uniref:Outer membrane stress sensor protease DegQ, serine protease n=1 Tax=hydrothermal vent metagenome TaxID=652676 RepID=A0A3B0XX62_9ZZZZ
MPRLPVLTFIFILFVQVNLSPVFAALPQQVNNKKLPTLAPMVKQVAAAVVNISTRSHITAQQNPLLNDPFFRHFFRQQPQQQRKRSRPQSLGSGVVINAEKGLVISNNHVVGNADEIIVTLRDGRELKAELLGADPEADVALLRVSAEALTEIKLADSDVLQVGDFVVAIGNPFGLGQTVTSGIVSAMGRSGLGIEGYEDFIQTDASINPGNSGGALVNLRGELVGMNTAILSPGGSGGNVGIGFAIPSNMVMQIVDHLERHGEVRRGVLGVVTQDLTPDLAQAFGVKSNKGTVIARVFADSAAAKAGLKAGDVVIEVNGRKVKNSAAMRNMVGLLRIGDSLNMRIVRDGRSEELTAKIAEPKLTSIKGGKLTKKLAGSILAQVQNPDNPEKSLVVVVEVAQGSPAWYARLKKGDFILSINRKSVSGLESLRKLLVNQEQILLSLQRGNRAMFVLLK